MFKNKAAEFVYTRTYSRWIEDLKRRETWEETVQRYLDFIVSERGTLIPSKVVSKIKKYMLEFSVMPSMRAVWAAGEAARKDNTTMFNCSFSNVNSPESFSECLYILMCGTGFGFSVSKEEVDKLPVVPTLTSQSTGQLLIEDSKAGWADSVKSLIMSLYSGKDLQMDYSLIRKKGARLLTMGGRASGPEPLISLHNYIRDVFSGAQNRKLKTIEAHDIQNKVAEVVVVGGVRRSSQISLSDLDDDDMRKAKIQPFPMHRHMSNNSAIFSKKPTSVEFLKEWYSLASSGSGERGIFNLEAVKKRSPNRRNSELLAGTNPCVTGDTLLITIDGTKRIDSLVGKTVTIWNGFDWSDVSPTITGIDQEIVTIKFSNKSTLNCTLYHKFHIEDELGNTKIVEAKELKVGDVLIKYYTPHTGMDDDIHEHVSIESISGIKKSETVYCFTEPKNNTAVFNGILTGQCGEIILRDKQFCNLSEVVVRLEDDISTLLDKIETATWIGAIQSTFTNFPYLSKEWKENCDDERLLGVSLTGQMDNHELLTPETLKGLKKKAIKVAEHAAKKLKINIPAAITCVKPSGTVSQLTDSSSGLHTRFSQYYIRRYRISSNDPLCKLLIDQNIPMVPETGQTKKDCSTWVVEFPIKAPDNSITRKDMSAIDQLEHYKKLQVNWCEHNASCTIYVKDEEWIKVGDWVYENWEFISGVSFLPYDGGIYKLAPYEEITKSKYEELSRNFPNIDYSQLSKYELEDQTEGAQNLACVAGICEI